jgi:zinc protease
MNRKTTYFACALAVAALAFGRGATPSFAQEANRGAISSAATAAHSALGAPAPAVGTLKIPPLALTDVKLDNGLRVIIAPDHTAPVYAICIAYNVGSRNERPGRTGFAHLFEHMMFQGSENVGKGEHFILIETNGGQMNGTTNEDRTVYFEILPKNQLDLGLYLEADRMRSLKVNQTNLDNQRNAVQEERRLGVDNQPYGRADLDMDNLSYDNFAYKHSTIGSMTDLNNASVSDVQDFFRIYYAPSNAVLTLVGDLDPVAALERVKHYFGSIPAQPIPATVDLNEEPHYGERSETIYDPLARLPQILMSYHIPAGNQPGSYAARLLAVVLGEGESSRFYQHLVKDKQLATSAGAQADARIGTSQFYIDATPRPGVKLEDLEKAIDEEIAAVVKSGITHAELDKAKAIVRRRFIRTRQSDLGTAVRIAQYAVYFNDPGLINTLDDHFNQVTLDQVHELAVKTFVPSERNMVITLRQADKPVAGGAPPTPSGNAGGGR